MQEETNINEVLQVIEFTGRGLGAILRTTASAARGAAAVGKGAMKASKWTSIQLMQAKLKLHYADKGSNSSLRLRDIEKITGGNYGIFKIPLERGIGKCSLQDIQNFFDALKVLKIPFAELPDLNVGDGFIEIAYNPQDAGKLKDFLKGYKFPQNRQAEDISLEEYMDHAAPGEMKELTKHAAKEAKKEMETQDRGEKPYVKKPERESPGKEQLSPKTATNKKSNERSKNNLERMKYDFWRRERFLLPTPYQVTVPKADIYKETEHGYIFKMSSEKKDDVQFWAASKKSCQKDAKNNVEVQIEKVEAFDVLDRNGKKITEIKGDVLHERQQVNGQKQTDVTGNKNISHVEGSTKPPIIKQVKQGSARRRK